METLTISAAVALVMAIFFLVELRTGQSRHAEALYLVQRVAERHGLQISPLDPPRGTLQACGLEGRERPLALAVPWSRDGAVVHYHLLRPGGERDSIALTAKRGARSRLGNLVIDTHPGHLWCAGLERLWLGEPELDPYVRIFTEPDRQVMVMNLLEQSGELLRLLKDVACRTPRGRFQLVDLGGRLKIQFDDRSLRFPSDVELASLDLLRCYQLYLVLAGFADVRDVPAAAAAVRP